jgi:hypothetical protein
MSQDKKALIEERIKLQNEYRDYLAKNGFDYEEYLTAPPGSFYERYRKRLAEIDAVLSPELDYWSG